MFDVRCEVVVKSMRTECSSAKVRVLTLRGGDIWLAHEKTERRNARSWRRGWVMATRKHIFLYITVGVVIAVLALAALHRVWMWLGS